MDRISCSFGFIDENLDVCYASSGDQFWVLIIDQHFLDLVLQMLDDDIVDS